MHHGRPFEASLAPYKRYGLKLGAHLQSARSEKKSDDPSTGEISERHIRVYRSSAPLPALSTRDGAVLSMAYKCMSHRLGRIAVSARLRAIPPAFVREDGTERDSWICSREADMVSMRFNRIYFIQGGRLDDVGVSTLSVFVVYGRGELSVSTLDIQGNNVHALQLLPMFLGHVIVPCVIFQDGLP